MPAITPETLAYGLIWYIVFLFSTTCHEAAHALAAKLGGDPTAFLGGQVSLNPFPHIVREPFGMVIAPLGSYFLLGWMMGWASAPYDPYWQARHPRRAAWMALAGPGANLLLALLAGLLIREGVAAGIFRAPGAVNFTRVTEAVNPESFSFAATLLSVLFLLNLLLAVLNLVPVPPLDGHTGITLLMSQRTALRFLDATRDPTTQIFGLIIASLLIGKVFRPIMILSLNLLYPGVSYH